MKKTIALIAIILMTFAAPAVIEAQGNKQGQAGQQQESPGKQGIGTASENLNRISERNNNPETGEQIRTMVQNHEKVQTRTKTALKEMSQRNQAMKFMIGPDYKNAGQVRSDVVGLRNDIRQLENIKDDASSVEDVGDVQGAIDDLEAEANSLEEQLEEQLSGFSLFGWLSKLFAN